MALDDTVLCAACQKVETPAASAGHVLVCRNCGTSLVLNSDGSTRKATAVDIEALNPADIQQLSRARAGIARADRRQR